MAKKKIEEEDSSVDAEAFLHLANELIPSLGPLFIKNKKLNNPRILLQQLINGLVMVLIILSITYLAVIKIIDGSAVTGLIGAVIGYVFGGLYQGQGKK